MFFNRNRPIPREDWPEPHGGGAKLWYVLTNHFFQLIWANLLCMVFCLPIVTIPAAFCGLHAVVQQYVRKGYGDVFSTFWMEFRTAFLPRLGLSAAMLCLPVIGWLLGGLLAEWAAYALCAVLLVFVLLVFGWFFPQLAILKLCPGQALRNAVLLTALESWRNLLLLLIQLVPAAVVVVLWPFTVIVLLTLVPVLPVLLMTVVVNPVLENKIIREP